MPPDCMENHIFWSMGTLECFQASDDTARSGLKVGLSTDMLWEPWATRSCGGWAWCQGATRPGSWATRSCGDCILILSSARWDEIGFCRGCCTGTWLGVQLTGIHCSNSGDRTSQPRGPGLHGPRNRTRGDHLQSWWEERSQVGLLHNWTHPGPWSPVTVRYWIDCDAVVQRCLGVLPCRSKARFWGAPCKVTGVSWTQVPLEDIVAIPLVVGSQVFLQPMLVANIEEVILGYAFRVNGEQILMCISQDREQRLRVVVAWKITLPPNSQVVTTAQLKYTSNISPWGLVEPMPGPFEKYGVLVGKALVDSRQHEVPVQVLNSTGEKVILHPRQTIAFCFATDGEPVERVDETKGCRRIHTGTKPELFPHVKELYDESMALLTDEEQHKLQGPGYRKSHCGDKMILRPSDRHNGIPYTDKITYLYWIRALVELSTRGPILSKKDYGPTQEVQHGVELTGKPREQWPKGQSLALQPVEEHEI